jgi:putative glutamine transport system substrate-binding protein
MPLLQIFLFAYNVIMAKGARYIVVFFFVVTLLVSCSQKPVTEIDGIKQRGVLRAGVKADVPGLGFLNPSTGLYEGLEIELAGLIAGDLLGSPDKTEFTAVETQTKGPLLESGAIDLVIGTFTITEERKQLFNFSSPYFTDALGLMVRKESALNGMEDMGGMVFGIVQAATSRSAIEALSGSTGLKVTLMEFPSYSDIKDALIRGAVDVFSADKSILQGYRDESTKLLPDSFAPQNYGIACLKKYTALAAYVDALVVKWRHDGTIDGLIKKMALF